MRFHDYVYTIIPRVKEKLHAKFHIGMQIRTGGGSGPASPEAPSATGRITEACLRWPKDLDGKASWPNNTATVNGVAQR
jgi:hypothetical protein